MKKDNGGRSLRRLLHDKKFWVRVLCGFLVFLMLLSAFAIVLQFFTIGSYAAESSSFYYDENGELLIAVGLMYADGVTVGFETRSDSGFKAGAVTAADRHFTPLVSIPDYTKVSVVCDANLAKTGMTYSLTSASSPVVGGWHLEASADNDIDAALAYCERALDGLSLDTFPCYVGGEYHVRIGVFGSEAQARAALSDVTARGVTAYPVGPSETALSVIDPETDTILFEYDGANASTLGLQPIGDGYLVTPAGNSYGGVFKFTRYITSTANGVALTNILTLDEYVKGVLPWEVSNKSSQNLLRTFAVAARSFALSQRKHSTFDMCNDGCCQMYKGLNRTNEAVIEAVEATHGIILAYEDTIARTTYCSSTGGITVAAAEAWGSTLKYPYLAAIVTPWEDYKNIPYGEWTIELTGAQIYSRLTANGYTGLNGDISSVEIGELADGSTYVYSLIVTDSAGKSVKISKSDTIRTVLGLYSANFVVGRAGQTLTVTDYSYDGDTEAAIAAIRAAAQEAKDAKDKEDNGGDNNDNTDNNGDNNNEGNITDEGDTPDGDGTKLFTAEGAVYVLTGDSNVPMPLTAVESIALTYMDDGVELNQTPDSVALLTNTGLSFKDLTEIDFIPEDEFTALRFAEPSTGENGDAVPLPDLTVSAANIVKTQRSVVAEGSAGSFVFIGRGWGHGVGISQYGARDMAALGYDYETILTTYFPGTRLTHWSEIIGKS